MRFHIGFRPLILLLVFAPAMTPAPLKPATLSAWDDYIQGAESRLQSDHALWIDQAPGRRDRVRNGEAVIAPMNQKPSRAVPNGLIHDWIGAIFLPDVSLRDVWAVLDDYERYPDYYGPTIRSAKLLSRNGDVESFRTRYVRKALLATVSLEVDYQARACRLDEHRWYSVARSTAMREIHDYGEPDERTLDSDDGAGYVWRAFNILVLDERDGGVYVEQESIALSRSIPASLHWMVEPFVERLSRELMRNWLRQTSNAVLRQESAANQRRPIRASDSFSGPHR